MDDVISRKVAIDALDKEYRCTDQSDDWDGLKTAMLIIENLPSAQPQRTGRWIDYVKDGYVECPFCHSATTCNDNISDLHFCFSCGARMEGEE